MIGVRLAEGQIHENDKCVSQSREPVRRTILILLFINYYNIFLNIIYFMNWYIDT